MGRIARIGLLALVLLVLGVAQVSATPTIQFLLDGTPWITIVDNLAGDSNLAAGAVTYVGALGPYWSLNVSTGTSVPVTGTLAMPSLDVSSVNMSTGSAPTLTILFTDTGFGALPPAQTFFQATIGGTLAPTGSLTYTAWLDPDNIAFAHDPAQDIQLASLAFGPNNGSSFLPFSGTANSVSLTPPTPYSLTQVLQLSHDGCGTGCIQNSSFNANLVAPVPEPSTLLLLGAGLAGLGGMRWRRKPRG